MSDENTATPSAPDAPAGADAIAARFAASRGVSPRFAPGMGPDAPVDTASEQGSSRGMDDAPLAPPAALAPVTPASAPAPKAAAAPAPGAPPAPVAAPAETERERLDRIAKLDARVHQERARARELEQRLQQLEQERQQEADAWRTDPLAALHRRGLTQSMLNERFLGVPSTGAPADGKAPSAASAALPPEVAQEIAEMRAWREQQVQREQQQQAQAAQQQHVATLKAHLEAIGDFSLLNELGAHDAVLAEVRAHTRNQPFEDEEQAAVVIQAIAHRVQSREQERLRSYLGQPGVRAFIEAEMQKTRGTGAPASRQVRQEPQDPHSLRTAAREQLDSSLATQRSYRPEAENKWDKNAAMQRAIQEASGLEVPT